MASLLELAGPSSRRFALGELNAIGRDPSSSVCLADPMVSPSHAQIRRDAAGRYVVVDLGTRRGTFHQDRRVSSAVLSHGDEIVVGPVRLRFEDDAPKMVEKTAIKKPLEQDTSASYPGLPILDAFREDNRRLRAVVELSQALSDAHDLPTLVSIVLDRALRLVKADRGAIVVFGADSSQPVLKLGKAHDGAPAEVTLSTSLLSEVLAKKKGIITADALNEMSRADSLLAQKIHSAMCVPLLHRDELIGIIHLDSQLATSMFHSKDLQLITAIASQAAAAIKNAQLAGEMKHAAAMERERLARLVGDLPDGVVLLDETQRVVTANPRGDEILELLDCAAPDQVIERLGELEIGDLPGRPPADLKLPGPNPRVLTISAHQSFNDGVSEMLLVFRDVTEQRAQDARTMQQGRLALIGQLAGGVAHDFNNLLAVIVNAAGFVRDEVTAPQMCEDVDQIIEASRRAAELVKQLLALGSGHAVSARVVKLDDRLAEMEKLLRRTLPEQVLVEAKTVPGLFRVKFDPTRLEQVLLNLAVNARDAMPSGGVLRLEAKNCDLDLTAARIEGLAPGRFVEICVIDTGSGMTPEVAARVFEPFFTTKEVGRGTGLGLATAYGILQQAGGNISVRSKIGEGSTFRLLIPATDEMHEEKAPITQRGTRGHETVLVAEDEPAVRKLVARTLRESGYRVIEAASGEEALRISSAGEVDLLVSDLVMPGMSGKQLAGEMLLRRPSTRVLFMSGYFGDKIGGIGKAAFIAKPFNRPELLIQVRALLDGFQQLR